MNRSTPLLTERLRILALFSALLAMQDRREAHDLLRKCLRSGQLPPEFFSELLLHLSLFLGYPPLLEGLEVLASIASRRTSSKTLVSSRESARRKGARIFRSVYGTQTNKVLQGLERLHPGLANQILSEAYGRIMARKGLDLAEREIANVVVLFTLEYKTQLISHLRGALRAGISRSVLAGILKLAGTVSGRSPAIALHLLNRLEKGKEDATF